MATVTQIIASVNDGRSTLSLRYDDVTRVVSRLSWDNPEGTWVVTLTKAGGAVVSRTLAPGASGGVNIQANRDLEWYDTRLGSNFELSCSWSL